MVDQDAKKSRRAKRRAAQKKAKAEDASPPVSEAGASEDEDEDEDDSGEGDSEDDASSKAKSIRDRNRKVRAAAAAKRRQKREKSSAAAATGLDTSEMVDDALARSTQAVTKWLRANFRWLQWVILAAVAGGIGWQIYTWRVLKATSEASDVLIDAVRADNGRIGEPPAEGDPLAPADRLPTFATAEEREKAAAKAYTEAAQVRAGSGTAILAKLGLAGVLYDQGKWDEAKATYEEVKSSKLAANDVDVRGRAAEGIGLTLEAKGDIDGALRAFRELENTDAEGLKELGRYHQARLQFAKGDNAKAKELLQKVIEKTKPDNPRGIGEPPGYLELRARELMDRVDPDAKRSPGGLDLPGGGANVDEDTLKLLEDVIGEATGKAPGKAPAVPAPPAPQPSGAP